MAPFLLDLPNEILLQIISKVPNADLDSLITTCKSLRKLAASATRQHEERKRTFVRIVYGDPAKNDSKITWVHPTLMLHDLLREDLCSYPRELSINDHAYEGADWDDGRIYTGLAGECAELDDSEVYQALQTFPDDVGPLVKACPHVNGDEDLRRGVLEKWDIGATLGLLINLLPNLTTLDFTDYNEMSHGIANLKQVFESMLGLKDGPDVDYPLRSTHPVCKLREINITRSDEGNLGDRWDLLMFAPLFYLPSMRSISVDYLHVYREVWDYPSRCVSHIEKLSLRSSKIDLESFETYIKGIKNLQELRLGVRRPRSNDTEEILPLRMAVHKLREIAAHSLRHLEIGGNVSNLALLRAGFHYIGDLSKFQVLKTITIGLTMFTTPSERLGSRTNDAATTQPGFPRKLIDVLPPSVLGVTFTRECTYGDEVEKDIIINMLQKLPEDKYKFVPNLGTIKFRFIVDSFRYETPELLRECREVGIKITHYGRDLN